MTDIIQRLDASLEEAEEQLLEELELVRNRAGTERFGVLEPDVRKSLLERVDRCLHDLQHSGDRSNLQLLTEQHEILYARIAVMKTLLNIRLPIAYLEEAHVGVETRRRRLDTAAISLRRKSGLQPQPGERLPGRFDHEPSRFQQRRNRLKITEKEARSLMEPQLFLDAGIFSASRELAMISSLARGGTIEEPPAQTNDDARKGKAIFESRDLSDSIPPLMRVAPVKQDPVPEKRDIAQTPEEIRRKLLARQNQTNTGKAVFGARDLQQSRPEPPPVKPAPRPEPEPPRTGRAIFAAKDIEPAYPSDPPRKREKEAEPEKKEEPRRGPAVFEARDLSNSPNPPKKT